MIKRIVFDIDGTLITNVNFQQSITNSLKKYGVEDYSKTKQFLLNIKEYEKIYNCYDKNLYLNFFSEKLNTKLDDKFLQILFCELRNLIPQNSSKIKRLLLELKEYELVLLSNYFEESQRNRLENMGINEYFSEYYGEEIIKPNKEVYIQAAGKCKPNECIIIGDDKYLDIDMPKKLGFNTIYVNEMGDINNIEQLNLNMIKKYTK